MRSTLLVASTFLPPICGGAEWAAWEIAKRITNSFEVHIITTSPGSTEIDKRAEIHRVPRLPWMPITYSTFHANEVKRILKEVRPDIIHCHMALPWGYILRNAPSSIAITCHGSEARKRHQPERYLISSALKHADVVTSPSKWFTELIETEYGQECVTIPNGVDIRTFRPLLDIQRRTNVVLFVGRFKVTKGVLDLLEAARTLPEYEFWFRGGSHEENVGRGAVEIAPTANVKVVEFIQNPAGMAALYNQATICAFPSHSENFPLVGLEAMACGKAVVATKGPRNGFSDFIDDGREGILVAPHDVKGLVDAIRYLMENKSERDEIEKNAIKKAAQYDWGIIAERYRILLEDIMHR
ncbi:MAG: glycosyltransferase family 4 protein [Candidatus Bathyarchaeia archaeon]|jgi:glycosyltransferase involved in cell wall biosynthesis